MWCRTILTAVAISYVLCMLLLSGLQKEDLDASTLEKLGKHNVNIDDMNNEQRRQECLLYSYSLDNATINDVTTEVQTETIVISSTNKDIETDVNVGVERGMRVAADIEDKTVAQNEVKINNTVGFYSQLPVLSQTIPPLPTIPALNEISKQNDEIKHFHNIENVTKIEENNGLQIEYNIQNQPDVESVMNFWSKLTHYTKTLVTKLPTTPASPSISTEKNVTTSLQIESHNNGYVHSKEMEYISRILAEYLASQTIPTTTQTVSTNYVPGKDREISNKPSADEELITKFPTKNSEQLLNGQNNEIRKMINFTRDDVHSNKVVYNSLVSETKGVPFKITYNSTQQIKTIQETPYSQFQKYEMKTRDSKPEKTNIPIKFLNSFLQIKNEYMNDGVPVPSTETPTDTINIVTNQSSKHEKSKTFGKYRLTQNMNDVNNMNSNNLDQTQNAVMKQDQIISESVEAETWEPIRSYKITNKQFKAVPIDNKDDQVKKVVKYGQFKNAPSNTNKTKRIKTLKVKTFDDIPTNKSKQIQNLHKNNNRIKVRPAAIKKPNLNKKYEKETYRYKSMLPSIKNSKLNKYYTSTNNQSMVKHTDFDNLEQIENVGSSGDQSKTLPEATKKPGRKRLSTINYHQFNAEPKILRNITQHLKELNDNEFMTISPETNKLEQIQDPINQINTIPESINNDERDNEQRIEAIQPVKNLKISHDEGRNIYETQTIPANFIKELAEKVKQIVLKDIEKDVTTTTVTSAPSTTTTTAPTTIPSTSMTTIITTSDKPSTLKKDITDAHEVIQKLMAIFKELKAMKETTKLTSQMPQNTATMTYGTTKLSTFPVQRYHQAVAPFNPYFMKTPPNFKPIGVNPYAPKIVRVPVSPKFNPQQSQATQYMPQLNFHHTKDYHSGAITIQTNSDEIAPLAIQISKPLKLINQHIVVTTKRSVGKLKEEQERESKKRIDENFRSPIEARNHREKLKLQSDFSKKVRFADNLKRHEFSDRYSYKSRFIKDREKPWHSHEYNEQVRHIENAHPIGSRFSESLNYPGGISHLEVGNPKGFGNTEGLNFPGGFNRPTFNQPVSHQNGINHLNGRLPGSYGHSDYDRQPRYEATKFHEKLERIENWPRSTWKEFKALSTDNSCDEISARQQTPLTKFKQRTRFDDTHFTNFLKSQQKVTDMLEKILANNVKSNGPRSVETP